MTKKRKLTDTNGDTPLHQKIRSGDDVASIIEYINSLDTAIAERMAANLNNLGETPLDLLERQNSIQTNPDTQRLAEKLHRLMLDFSKLPSVKAAIDANKINDRYQATASETLMQNLMLACTIINTVREQIDHSSTHPYQNERPEEERHDTNASIVMLRIRHRGKYNAALIRKLKVGNCLEYAMLGIDYVQDKSIMLAHEYYQIENGDHVFIVLGRDKNTDVKDFNRWNESTVVCDAWAGDAYPAYEIPSRLKSYTHIQRYQTNILNPFNTEFHELSPMQEDIFKTNEPVSHTKPPMIHSSFFQPVQKRVTLSREALPSHRCSI